MIQFSNGTATRKDGKMTGKELIMYILQNDLEDKPIFENGNFLDFMTVEKAAVKYDVGSSTVLTWIKLNVLPSITINDVFYIPKDAEDPRKVKIG